jgi:iron complex outermembrane receptor protein
MANEWRIVLAGVLSITPVSWALGQSAPQAESNTNGQLEEVVVTAQRRGENLQSVPISVSAIDADSLQASGVSSTQDLGMVAAGLSMEQATGSLQPHIRGIGTSANGPGIESPVAIYVDGVYYANALGSVLTLNDIERVEVLKGPQGTLFGRNTTGGLIQIISKDPSQEFSGREQVSYGDYQDVIDNFYVTGGLTSALASDLSFHYEHQGQGYGTNIFNGSPVDRMDHDYALRNKYLLQASDTTQVRLSLDYEDKLTSLFTAHPINEGTSGAANAIVLNSPVDGGPFPLGGQRDVDLYVNSLGKLESGGGTLNIKQDLGPLTLTSITAYRDAIWRFDIDIGFVPIDSASLPAAQRDSQFSQEFQLASGQSAGLKWAAGLYYFWAKDSWDPLQIQLRGPESAPLPGINIDYRDQQRTNSFAAYAQATQEIFANTNLTLGARYTYETKNFEGSNTVSFPGLPIPTTVTSLVTSAYPDHLHEDKPSYRVSLDHNFTENLMSYVSWTTGFKSGGYNISAPNESPYAPETVESWEVGTKTEWLDHRFRFNASAFHYDYKDIQIGYFIAGSEAFRNGAEAQLYGLDVEFDAVLTKGLTFSGGLEWLHDRFLSFPDAPIAVPGVACTTTTDAPLCVGSAANNRLPYAPNIAFDVGLHYTTEILANRMDVDLRDSYTSQWFGSPDNTVYQAPFHVLNAAVQWTDQSGHFSASLWGKNLTNTFYAEGVFEAPQGVGRTLGAPRTFGLSATYRFGAHSRS